MSDSRTVREPYATPDEVAAYYKIAKGTLYNWRYRGRGPQAIRVGGQIRYRWSDVEKYAQPDRRTA